MTEQTPKQKSLITPLTRTALILTIGVILAILSTSNANAAASYKCTRYSNSTERTICKSRYLSSLDRKMSRAYWKLYRSVDRHDRNYIKQDQRAWLHNHRNHCNASKGCISKEYALRMDEFKQLEREFGH